MLNKEIAVSGKVITAESGNLTLLVENQIIAGHNFEAGTFGIHPILNDYLQLEVGKSYRMKISYDEI